MSTCSHSLITGYRWSDDQQRGQTDEQTRLESSGGGNGFGALSRRLKSNKPIIAAVNGIGAFGGGTEIVLNCDLVVASETARFALPEVRSGVVAAQGGMLCGFSPCHFFSSYLPLAFPTPFLSRLQ